MRILIRQCHAEGTGSVVRAATWADALEARGHAVLVLSDDCEPLTGTRHLDVPPGPRASWRGLTALTRLVRLVRTHRIQIVHDCAPAPRWESRTASFLTGAALIGTTALEESRSALPAGDPPVMLAEGAPPRSAIDLAADRLERVYRARYVQHFRREIPILCYHRLVESEQEAGRFATHIQVGLFEQQLRFLRDHGYRTLHFADLDPARVFESAEPCVILTFDDGYEDNYRLLLPLLIKYDAKAVVYLVSSLQTNEWDLPKGEPSRRLLTPTERRAMLESGLVEFGAHTRTHPDLTEITLEQARDEIRQSKLNLEAQLGVAVETFAYPYGHLNQRVRESVREAGFRYALALQSGPVDVQEDPWHVRRIVVFPGTTLRRFRRKVSGGYGMRAAARSRDRS